MDSHISRKRAPLTFKQKKYRRDNNLCMYCGDAGHSIVECSRVPKKQTTVTGVTSPVVSETSRLPKTTAQPTGATRKKRNETSTNVSLLTLPREIRNKVYEELFYLDEFQIQQFGPWTTLHPNILAVCRQIHHEASGILYDDNGWVTLKAAFETIDSLNHERIKLKFGFPGADKVVTRYENDQLSQSAILDISLHRDSDSDDDTVDLVIPLAGIPRFCRLLTQSRLVSSQDLVLKFNHRAKNSHRSRFLWYIGQARGLRRVVFTGAEPPLAAIHTAAAMQNPYTHLVEITNTASAYQASSEYESKHGRTFAARNLMQDGVDFIDWWLDKIRGQMAQRASLDITEMNELFQTRADMGFACASISLRLGSTDLAQNAVGDVLERLSSTVQLYPIHEACAHYHMAQTFEAVGWKNAALYGYLQALRICPGYRDADAAVDRMEQNLGSGTAFEEAKLRYNIDHVLRQFRHQSMSARPISTVKYAMIFKNFEGTASEIRSVDRNSYGETDLVYMNPEYGRTDHGLDGDDIW